MRIAIEAGWWTDGPPSGKNVIRSLISEWAQTFPGDELIVLIPRNASSDPDLRLLAGRYPNTVIRKSWASQQAAIALSAGWYVRDADWVLTQNFRPVFSRTPRVVFVHDLIVAEHPEWFTRTERAYLGLSRMLLNREQRIVTSSASEKLRIERHTAANRVTAIGLGLSNSFENASPCRPRNAPTGPYILAVGRLNVRKNLTRLIAAFAIVQRSLPELQLVIVGAPDGLLAETSIDPNPAISWTGYVADSELKWLYSNSDLFVFPSLDEGFGLPLLEAISVGCPIVASNIPAFLEFGSQVHRYFDPHSEVDMARTILRAIAEAPEPVETPRQMDIGSWRSVVQKLRATVQEVGAL